MAALERFYVIDKSSNSVYYSDDFGDTWTEIPSNVSTSSASDIAVNPAIYNNILVLSGSASATTPYLSVDGAQTFNPGLNISGKEILYVSSTGIIVGGKRLKSNTGSQLFISNDAGTSFTNSINTASLFSYPGANYGNITVVSVDFTADCGGYIAIAGDENNINADQILTRTYDAGVTFPDSIILDGNVYGVIRCVYSDPSGKIIFAAGDPAIPGSGKIYQINNYLTDIPIEVLAGISVGDTTNTTITKFFTSERTRDLIFFIDATGNLYQSSDSGTNWTLLSNVPGNCVDIITIDSGSIILALTSSPSAILKSINGGLSWVEISQPTWTSPEAIAYIKKNECLTCPDGYTQINYSNPFASDFEITCEEKLLAGPLCKPPYVYFAAGNACASPATLGRVNIIYSVDYSGSLNSEEIAQYKQFLAALTGEISDRLELGTVKVGMIKWASNPCNVLDFTSDITAINNAILDDSISCNIGGGTNHVTAFCTAVRMFEAENQVNPAKSILIVLTDGPHTGTAGCSLVDLGFEPNIPFSPGGTGEIVFQNGTFLELANDVKQNLLPEGLQIMVTIAGDPYDRVQMNNQFIIDPLNDGYEPYPSATQGGGYYYFDAGNFDNFPEIVQQIRLGLAADLYPVPPCPEGCVGVPGPDSQGYCECLDSIPIPRCVYKLTDCTGITGPFYSSDPRLNDNVDSLNGRLPIARFKLNSGVSAFSQPGCFEITRLTDEEVAALPLGTEIKSRAITDVEFADCPSCTGLTITKFTNCVEPTDFVYTEQSLSNFGYDPTKPVLKNTNPAYIDKCWFVDPDNQDINPSPIDNTFLLAIDSQYAGCPECLPLDVITYKLTDNCENNLPDIYTDRDFGFAAGQVIKVLQYPDVCWTVSINLDENVIFENLSVDGLPFSTCQECLPVPTVSYTLTNCNDEFNQLATQSNLNQYIGGVVRLTTTGDTCWIVTPGSNPNLVVQSVSVSQSFTDCPECYPQIFQFVSCSDENIIIYTQLDFSPYVGQFVNLQEYPGICWACNISNDLNVVTQNLTFQGIPYSSCGQCQTTYYQLTNCSNSNVFLISSSTELSAYVGRVITAANYRSLCFSVTQPKCDCIRITINEIQYDAYAEEYTYNDRKLYRFTSTAGDPLALGWSINPNRWELFNQNTLETYGFSNQDIDCPFINFWLSEPGSSYIITSVTYCVNEIYNISPELEYVNCEPCINCI